MINSQLKMHLDFFLPAQNFSVNTLSLFEIVEKFSENLFHLEVDYDIFGSTCFQLECPQYGMGCPNHVKQMLS